MSRQKTASEHKRPTLDTRLWELPDITPLNVSDHENDVTTAQFKLLMNGGIPEWESEGLVAFIHVVHRFKKYITDPSSIKKCNKVLEALPTVIMAALIKRYEVGLQNLNKLYRLSIEQKI